MKMADLNKFIGIGRLTADPELKTTTSGISVISFTIAINRPKYKDQEKAQADFINIVAWRTQAEFVSKYFKKGQAILIVGAIQTRNYEDKEGKKRTAFEVVADEVQFAEPRAKDTSGNSMPSVQNNLSGDDFQQLANDDELPF